MPISFEIPSGKDQEIPENVSPLAHSTDEIEKRPYVLQYSEKRRRDMPILYHPLSKLQHADR
jgi:hypothetical protein